MDIKEQVKQQFGFNAAQYVSSPRHAAGDDLKLLSDWIRSERAANALDIATGGGHTALVMAEHIANVTAIDLTEPMLREAESFLRSRGCTRVRFVPGDAEALPFEAEQFDLAACRIAAHHFPDADAFIRESARVLKPEGCFILFDNVSPESEPADVLYNEIEKRRDPSHYRAWTKTEWIKRVELAGLRVEQLAQTSKTFVFESWCRRMNVPAQTQQALEAYVLSRSAEMQRKLGVRTEEGKLISFQGNYMMLKARKEF